MALAHGEGLTAGCPRRFYRAFGVVEYEWADVSATHDRIDDDEHALCHDVFYTVVDVCERSAKP